MKTQRETSRSRKSKGRRTRATGKSSQTIGDVLGHLSDGYTAAEGTVSEITDGLFQTSFLATYEHRFELVLCCAIAIHELADSPCNPKARAAVMGRAMELLRAKRGLNTPRGWYPVMKELRAMPDDGVGRLQAYEDDDDGAEQQDEDEGNERTDTPESPDSDDEDSDIVPPEGVLTNWQSVLNCTEVDEERELQSLALEKPEIKAAFISLARELGVPGIYKEGFEFMNVLITRLGTVPDAVLRVRDRLRYLARE